MKYWTEYKGHDFKIQKNIDNTIYTFDIETSSYLLLGEKQIPASEYLTLSEDEKENAIACACMYVWQFSVNDIVYYGRTWAEFLVFLKRLDENSRFKKIIFVHNLSYEFQFFSSQLKIKKVLSRKSRKVMSCELADYNMVFRCSLYMSNVALEYLPKLFNLSVQKMVGDLDYSKIRTPITPLSKTELGYCENDCLVVYEYIKMELETYGCVKKIPLTSTGKVRKELQKIVLSDPYYRRITRDSINITPTVYNMLIEAFAGGYTHANFMYTDEVLNNVDSYDETSAYPYVMVAYKYPMKAFRECNVRRAENMIDEFAYLLRVTFRNIHCKYYNNFISASKCNNIVNASIDNGRIIRAKEINITLTDVDFKFILDTYDMDSYEIESCYYSQYNYLPKLFVDFILDKYVNKTKYKNVKGKELEYIKEKNKFNSLYGMTVTNMIRDEVEFDNKTGWTEKPLTDVDIFEKLCDEKNKAFLSFAWGVWVTSYARNNLLRRVMALDEYTVYCDTDSLKCVQGYDKKVFDDYNKTVEDRIRRVAKEMDIPLDKYQPEDSKGVKHLLGVFECETDDNRLYTYDKFITQGAKKYAVEKDGKIEITVSGVPKCGAKALHKIDDFRDDLLFDYSVTNKHMIMYNDDQKPIELIDYNGLKYKVEDKTGACLLPTTYVLGKSYDYANLLTENSSQRAKFKQET